MSLPPGVIHFELDDGPVVASGNRIINTLQRIKGSSDDVMAGTQLDARRVSTALVGFGSGVASLKFQFDGLDNSLLRVKRSNLEVSRAQEEVNRLQAAGKTSTLDYQQAVDRLSIAKERLRQNTQDAQNAQYAFAFSILQTALQIPTAIDAVRNLTASTTLLNVVTSKWTLIALGVIGVFEGIAHIIKAINPELDYTIESFGRRLTNAFGSASAGAEEYTGAIDSIRDAHKSAKEQADYFSGGILNLTSYWKDQNEKISANIRLLREQAAVQKDAIKNSEEVKKKLKAKGTLWDAIIDFLFKPNLLPSANAEEATDFAERIEGAYLGTSPGAKIKKAVAFTPRDQIIIDRLFNALPKDPSVSGDPATNWADMVWRATFAPDTLGQIGEFPKPPFSIQDMWADALRNAGVNRLSTVKSEFQKQLDKAAKDLLVTLQGDQELIRRQREVSGLLALKELQEFRQDLLIQFVGEEVYKRATITALRHGATVEEAEEIAREAIKHTSKGEIEVLTNGNIVVKTTSHKSALGGTFLGPAGISGIGNLFGRNDISLSEMTGNMSLTLQNLGFGALSSYTKSYGIGGTANILGRRQSALGMMGGVQSAVSRIGGGTQAKGKSSKHGGNKPRLSIEQEFAAALGYTLGSPDKGNQSFFINRTNAAYSSTIQLLMDEGVGVPSPYMSAQEALNRFGRGTGQLTNPNFASQLSAAITEANRRRDERLSPYRGLGYSDSDIMNMMNDFQGMNDLQGMKLFKQLASLG